MLEKRKSRRVSRNDGDNVIHQSDKMSEPYSPGNQNILRSLSARRVTCPLVRVRTGVRAVPQGTRVFPCTPGHGDCVKTWPSLCPSRTCSDFYIVPIEVLSERCFDCVARSKCRFIYGCLRAQSFIRSWLRSFVP